MRKTKNFTEDEFKCSCCGKNFIDWRFVKRLQKARSKAGVPFIINSGYRCEKHNAEVGGVSGSAHVKGLAADIVAVGGHTKLRIIQSLLGVGFTRLGIGKSYVHVDMDNSRPDGIWVYKR